MAHAHAHLRRALTLALTAALAQPIVAGVAYAETVTTQEAAIVTAQQESPHLDVACAYSITDYGNIKLDLPYDTLEAAGFSVGDIIRVSFLDKVVELPICESFNEVPYSNASILKRKNGETYKMTLTVNGGDFATTYNVATSTTDADGSISWTPVTGLGDTVNLSFEMVEKGGYEETRKALDLTYTDERSDYPDLTDEQFANFREVTAGSIAKGVLWRSASPINPKHNRNTYAEAAIKRAGVTHLIDLADTEESLALFEHFPTSYIASAPHFAAGMTVDIANPTNAKKLAEAVRYIADNDGSFDVFCLEGKDRTGFTCAIIECLMGATPEDIVDDYMITYKNYYGVKPGDARYDIIANMNIRASLAKAFGIDAIEGSDLVTCATAYLKANGLTDADIEEAKSNLSQPATRSKTYTIHRRVADAA